MLAKNRPYLHLDKNWLAEAAKVSLEIAAPLVADVAIMLTPAGWVGTLALAGAETVAIAEFDKGIDNYFKQHYQV